MEETEDGVLWGWGGVGVQEASGVVADNGKGDAIGGIFSDSRETRYGQRHGHGK